MLWWWWSQDGNRKSRQTNKLSVRVGFIQRHKVPARSGATLPLAAPPLSVSLSLSWDQTLARSVLQFVSGKCRKWTHALTHLCTSYEAGSVFHCARSPVCFPVKFALCLASRSFLSLFAISASLSLSLPWTLSSFRMPVYLWDRTLPASLLVPGSRLFLMHQLVCCLDSFKVKRAEGGRGGGESWFFGTKQIHRNLFFLHRENKQPTGWKHKYKTASGPFVSGS